MRLVGRFLLLAVWLTTAGPLSARRLALTDDYVIDSWQTEDGLPENSATAMVQTADGFLWFGTFNGLVRFDGNSFKVYDSSNTPELPARRIANLHLDRQGTMWISFERGIALYRNGRFTKLPAAAGFDGNFVRSFAEAADGRMFATTFDGKLYRIANDEFIPLPNPNPAWGDQGYQGYQGASDPEGRFYVGGAHSKASYFGYWTGTNWIRCEVGAALVEGRFALTADREGAVWLLNDQTLQKWVGGQLAEQQTLTEEPENVWGMNRDAAGTFWISSYKVGLYRVNADQSLTRFRAGKELIYDAVRFVFEDREGSHWVGTSGGGLLRFMNRRVQAVGFELGLTERIIKSVAAMKDGRVAIGTWGQGVFIWDPAKRFCTRLEGSPIWVEAVLVDRQDRLWVATYQEGCWMGDGTRLNQLWREGEAGRDLVSLGLDQRGRVWALGSKGVTVIDGDERTTFANPAPVVDAGFVALAEDKAGRIWLGSPAGLFRFDNGAFVPYRPASGLAPKEVMALNADDEGRLWVGSASQGLFLVQEGRSFQFTPRTGLPVRNVTGLGRDSRGRLWLATNRGLLVGTPAELVAVAAGDRERAALICLGTEDGMVSQESVNGHQPMITTDRTGTMWFATPKGLATVLADRIEMTRAAPTVMIDEVRFFDPQLAQKVVGAEREAGWVRRSGLELNADPLALPAGSRLLEIAYMGASMTHPERVRFETRLIGASDTWLPAEARRVAYYPELRPGSYRLQVRAYNQDGLVSETPATLSFSIAPYYWQTWWFQAGGVAALMSLFGGAVNWSAERQRRQRVVLAGAQEAARERYVQVIENTSDLVSFATPDRKFFYINRAMRKLVGMADDVPVSRWSLTDIYPGWAYRMIANEALPAALQDGRWEGKSALLTRGGREIPTWQALVAHRKPDGSLDFISSIGRDLSAIFRAEDALRMSEDKFSKAFRGSPDAICLSRVDDGQVLEVNEGFTRMFGGERVAALGKPVRTLGHWLDPEECAHFFRLFRDVGRVRNFEASFLMAGKNRGTGLVSAEGVELEGKASMVMIVRDISDRKRAEAAVQASRNMFRQVLDAIPVRVFWKDREGVFGGGNQLWAQDGGFSTADELVGKTDFDFSNRAEAERFRADDRIVFESGQPKLNYEEPRDGLGGAKHWLLTSKIPMRNVSGQVTGLLGIYQDITERKRVDSALREHEAKLEMALDASAMGVWEWRIRTNEVIWSSQVAVIFGLRPDEFKGTLDAYQERILPDDLAMVGARINEALAGVTAEYRVEHRIQWADASIHWLEARGTVFRDAEGRPERLVGTVWDVTRRKSSENDLLRIAQGVGGISGLALTNSILSTLSVVTGADFAFLGRLVEGISFRPSRCT